jgi:ectoine hydroxylase-related dioxygenase (phytanoyl-CoA dioxygenase family)
MTARRGSRLRDGQRRDVTDDEVLAFERDGVVCLRGILDPGSVAELGAPIEALLRAPEMADLTGMAAAGPEGSSVPGRFRAGVDHWRTEPALRAFASDSALPATVGALLRTRRVTLWEDSVLVKEPATRERTVWHQDLGYFNVDGEQLCTTWVPLDPVTAATGAMRFARGSHTWDRSFRPNLFVTDDPIPGTEGDAVPDVDALAARGEVEILSFDLGPGDLTVHHARTLHAAGANTSATQRRRALSVRYCGDDARYHLRAGMPPKSHHAGLRDGDALGGPEAPVVWST